MRRAALIALVLCYPYPSRSQDSTTALVALCDQAAANPLDKDRPADVAGIELNKIDPKIAIPACEAAAKVAPNDPRIMYQLGRSNSAAKAHETALTQYSKAADQGYAAAQVNLGNMYRDGRGVPQDYAAAVNWYRKAADQGYAAAQSNLGRIYRDGRGVPKDYAAAVSWYRKAADQGYAYAQNDLGNMYSKGQGVPQDYAAAVSWYRRAADQGYAYAQSNLGNMYRDGRGVPQDYAAAVSWYRKAGDQGHARAQDNLGIMYHEGKGVLQNYAAAVSWFRKAADQGYASAQSNLGYMYHEGKGVPQDYAAAVSWYRKAADQGHAWAQDNLGNMYHQGKGVLQNYAAAVSWFRKAADHGYASAQRNLGIMYANGQGVPQDYISAHTWLNLAAATGDKDAVRIRDGVTAKMAPAQIAEAQKRAAEWRPKMENAAPTQAAGTEPEEPDSKSLSGTAFFVSKEGKALTNAHVVQGCRQISVITEGLSSAAKVLAKDERNDLALLATGLHPAQTASWRPQVRQGEEIVVYGFPLPEVLASGGNVAVGNVTALAGLGNDSRFLQISSPVQPGNSGGPLLDRSGNVAGIVVSKLNALGVASVTGDIPQNVNFAIKASVAAAFLDAQHVTHAESAGAGALSTPEIAERAKSFTVQVICVR
jgi:TPR repeat protein